MRFSDTATDFYLWSHVEQETRIWLSIYYGPGIERDTLIHLHEHPGSTQCSTAWLSPHSRGSAPCSLSSGHVGFKPGKLIPTTGSLQKLFPMPGLPPSRTLYNHPLLYQETHEDPTASPFYKKVRFPLMQNLSGLHFSRKVTENEKPWWREAGRGLEDRRPNPSVEWLMGLILEDHFPSLSLRFSICKRAI